MLNRLLTSLFTLLGLASLSVVTDLPVITGLPAMALVRIDSSNTSVPIKYGMQNSGGGIIQVLGSNWIEGDKGILLNIYSPFMQLATQASKKGLSEVTPENLKTVRKKLNRTISLVTDTHLLQEVKFAVALEGDSPTFASQVRARIEGLGRGRTVNLKPARVVYDKQADATDPNRPVNFEAVNAYYFYYKDLENLETFQFILTSPTDETIFNIDNQKIY